MRKMLIRAIIRLGMKDRKKFIRLLATIEYGVAIFCFKLQREAMKEERYELAQKLEIHALQEDKHGKMLGGIVDGVDRISRTGNGRWVSIFRSTQNLVKNSIPASGKPKTLEWDSVNYPGERLTGTLENFDGLSSRYLAGRLLFRGRAAFDYLWPDRLALMCALEEETASFYQQMLQVLDEQIRGIPKLVTEANSEDSKSKEIKDLIQIKSIISLIIGEELSHANYLKEAMKEFSLHPEETLQKWRDRIFWASPALLIDFIYFYVIH